MENTDLISAKTNKNDEFYTQYVDIDKEISNYIDYNPFVFSGKTVLCPCDNPETSNFTKYFLDNFINFGLKKLISTSIKSNDETKGRICIVDNNSINIINNKNVQWDYLNGDGDFRSNEINKLRDEADIIITNPPFSLFREFISWIRNANSKKLYSIIGNMNAVTCKDIFPLIKNNEMWFGPSISSGDREFEVPDNYPLSAAGWRIDELGKHYVRVKGVRWFTNIENGKRHEPLQLMTMKDNIAKSHHKSICGHAYQQYDNYSALDVSYTDAIPFDYTDVMGVPISFLDKYCPNQFEILNANDYRTQKKISVTSPAYYDMVARPIKNGNKVYRRIFIRKKNNESL